MLRPLLRFTAAIAFAALLVPAAPQAAPPPGLQYDEIVRVVTSGTPPPPGSFQAEVASLQAQTPVAAAPATPTPAPRRRGIGIGAIGSIVGGVIGGSPEAVAGAVAGVAIDQAAQAQVERETAGVPGLGTSVADFLRPHLMRYAYWNNWERVDDLTAQSATIRKCDLGQVLQLDLARRTYTLTTPQAEASAPRPAAPGAPPAAAPPEQPGTATATLTSTTRNLGALTIENQPTTGYDTTTSYAMTKSTGSCRDGNARFETIEYLTNLRKPTVQCPLRRDPLPESPVAAASRGGCRPTFAANQTGPTPPQNRLSLYTLMRVGGEGASGAGFLTERGNLKTLTQNDAALFEVPAGFTKQGG